MNLSIQPAGAVRRRVWRRIHPRKSKKAKGEIRGKSLKGFRSTLLQDGSSIMQRRRDRGERRGDLPDLRLRAGRVRRGDGHGDSRVLPLDLREPRGLMGSKYSDHGNILKPVGSPNKL